MKRKAKPSSPKKSNTSTSESDGNMSDSKNQHSVIFIGITSGIVGLLVTGYFIFFYKPTENDLQYYFIKILLSLSAAGFSLCLTGFIKIKYDIPGGIALEAGGAVAIFFLVLWLFPKNEIDSPPYKILSLEDNIDLTNWRPYSQDEHKTVRVTRLFKITIVKDPKNKTVDYKDTHATTSLDGLDIYPVSSNLNVSELENPTEIGKRSYLISISNSEFIKDTLIAEYKIDYWNCHKLDSPIYKKNDISKNIPYPTKLYSLKVTFPKEYKWNSIPFFSTSPNGKETKKEIMLNSQNGQLIQIFVDTEYNLEAGTMLRYFLKGFAKK